MNDELNNFLDFLYKDQTGKVYLACKTPTAFIQEFFMWPKERAQVVATIARHDSLGESYIAPALFKFGSSKKQAFKSASVKWLDYDGDAPINLNGDAPDLMVSTSGNRVHAYWNISTTTSTAEIESLNQQLVEKFNADPSGFDATQVLRPPGTTNKKHGNSVSVISFIPPVEKSEVPKSPTGGLEELLSLYSISDSLQILLLSKTILKGDRSTKLTSAAHQLAEHNVPRAVMDKLIGIMSERLYGGQNRDKQNADLIDKMLEQHSPLILYSPQDVLASELKLDWLIEGWLHATGIMIVTGQPGVGKSQLCLDISYRLATGSHLFGKKIPKPVRILFLSLEMAIQELRYIIAHQIVEFTDTAWSTNFSIYAPSLEATSASYEQAIKLFKPQVVIIDSLSELATDELKEAEARKLMGWARQIREENNCAIIFIHHNRKPGDGNKKADKLSDLYGSFIFGKLTETVVGLFQADENSADLDIAVMKARFSKRETITITRSEHLTFTKREGGNNASGNPGTGQGFGKNAKFDV